mmetsp:Transcript_18493/g.51087  ORF Transcript_18493/g.51087 Transcript_18493/m.51087 type:complete len:323 (+) Transcript_18493:992-1960(+)
MGGVRVVIVVVSEALLARCRQVRIIAIMIMMCGSAVAVRTRIVVVLRLTIRGSAVLIAVQGIRSAAVVNVVRVFHVSGISGVVRSFINSRYALDTAFGLRILGVVAMGRAVMCRSGFDILNRGRRMVGILGQHILRFAGAAAHVQSIFLELATCQLVLVTPTSIVNWLLVVLGVFAALGLTLDRRALVRHGISIHLAILFAAARVSAMLSAGLGGHLRSLFQWFRGALRQRVERSRRDIRRRFRVYRCLTLVVEPLGPFRIFLLPLGAVGRVRVRVFGLCVRVDTAARCIALGLALVTRLDRTISVTLAIVVAINLIRITML